MSSKAHRVPVDAEVQTIRWPAPSEVPPPAVTRPPRRTGFTRSTDGPQAPAPSAPAVDVEGLEAAAFARGAAQGRREATDQAGRETQPVLQRLAATIDEVAALRPRILRQAERDLVRLAVGIAERVVRRELALDRELLLVMAHVAVERLGEGTTAAIHLHPADHAAAMSARDTKRALPPGLEVAADASLPRGGCLVKSEFGVIDLSVDAQMGEVSRALFGETQEDEETLADSGGH